MECLTSEAIEYSKYRVEQRLTWVAKQPLLDVAGLLRALLPWTVGRRAASCSTKFASVARLKRRMRSTMQHAALPTYQHPKCITPAALDLVERCNCWWLCRL